MNEVLFKAIREGGNLSAMGSNGIKSATKLQMTKFTPEQFEEFKTQFMSFLLTLNDMFERKYGFPAWEDEAYLQSGNCFSGSSRTFFQKPFATYAEYKKKVGDFDIQVDEKIHEQWGEFTRSLVNQPIGDFTIYGNTSNFAQDHSLVIANQNKYKGVGAEYMQVDWEYVPYENGHPTEFATFAHYSSWEDLENNVKGLFIKYLLRAIAHCNKTEGTIEVSPKTGRPVTSHGEKILNPSSIAFSVDKGVRNKLKPWLNDDGTEAVDEETGLKKVYKQPTKESEYTTDVDKIFELFFHRPPKSEEEKKKLYSFVRTLSLMEENFTKEEICRVFDYFIDLIWAPYAQKLSAFDKDEDKGWKETAVNKFYEVFPYLKDKFGDEVADKEVDYYSTYVNRQRDAEITDEGGTGGE